MAKLYGLILKIGKLLKTSSLSFIEKGSHSFKESYGLKEFISHIQSQSTVLQGSERKYRQKFSKISTKKLQIIFDESLK